MSAAQPLRALQIEDNAGDARLVQELLRDAASDTLELDWADRLATGMEKLRMGSYDVVLLDLGLPDSQGLATFDLVHSAMPDQAIIVLSGMEDEETATKALQRGAQDYLFKGEEDGRSFLRAIRYAVERKNVRMALMEERDLLRAVMDCLPDHIYVKDKSGRFIRANRAAANFFGMQSPEELLGKTDFQLFPAELAREFFEEEERIMNSGECQVNRETCLVDPSGSRHWMLTTKVPFRNHGGAVVVGTVGINRDVTSIKAAEERLRAANAELARSQDELRRTIAELKTAHQDLREAQLHLVEVEKLQSVGRLAAGVAHEVKNPLAVALRGIEYLAASPHVSQDAGAVVVIQDMHDAIRRAETVIRGLLDYAAPRKLAAAPQAVNELLERALLLVKHELERHKIAVTRELDPGLPACRLDPQKVQEVFINVYENAIHAMSGGGTLTVRSYSKTLTGMGTNVGDRRNYRFGMGETIVVIEIEDTGVGIPEDRLTKIFDPFFTTKPAGQGTGLGLTVSRTIVELHGGTIQISNRLEGGAKVVIMFPPDVTSPVAIPANAPAEPGMATA